MGFPSRRGDGAGVPAGGLPPRHGDPSDRMPIAPAQSLSQAQSQAQGRTLVTRNAFNPLYDVGVLTV
ncbi:hypothetical protein [Streptomyces xanthophaeus]